MLEHKEAIISHLSWVSLFLLLILIYARGVTGPPTSTNDVGGGSWRERRGGPSGTPRVEKHDPENFGCDTGQGPGLNRPLVFVQASQWHRIGASTGMDVFAHVPDHRQEIDVRHGTTALPLTAWA